MPAPSSTALTVPGVSGGFNSTSVLFVIAIVGTTVAPWQLFFQQSNIVDKRITPRWINYERTDTVIGSIVTVFAASLIIAVCAVAFAHTKDFGHFTDAKGVANGLAHYVGHGAGAMFAIILLNASIIGAAAVTLATSYAFGDVFGVRHSLHRGWREAKLFYGTFTGMVVVAAAIVLIPRAPLGLITTGVQALAGVLLPSATVFLLLLCNDKDVLGPWVNRPLMNIVSSVIVSVLLVLSLILMITTVFTHIDVRSLAAVLGVVLLVAYAAAAIVLLGRRRRTRRGSCAGSLECEARDLADASAEPPRPTEMVPWTTCGHVRAPRLPGRRRGSSLREGDPARPAQVGWLRRFFRGLGRIPEMAPHRDPPEALLRARALAGAADRRQVLDLCDPRWRHSTTRS